MPMKNACSKMPVSKCLLVKGVVEYIKISQKHVGNFSFRQLPVDVPTEDLSEILGLGLGLRP